MLEPSRMKKIGVALKIAYRVVVEKDAPKLRELIAESARGLSLGFYSESQVESALKFVFGVDSQLIADGTYFIGESAGEVVACGGWSKRKTLFGGDQFKGKIDPLLDPWIEPARIRAFFVHPQWGRKGIGQELLKLCEAAARAEEFTRLELGSTMPGVPFYTAQGFRAMEQLELTFPNGVTFPLTRMGKDLPEEAG